MHIGDRSQVPRGLGREQVLRKWGKQGRQEPDGRAGGVQWARSWQLASAPPPFTGAYQVLNLRGEERVPSRRTAHPGSPHGLSGCPVWVLVPDDLPSAPGEPASQSRWGDRVRLCDELFCLQGAAAESGHRAEQEGTGRGDRVFAEVILS